jgi:tRNA A-37 threonylcarbamoyl transferase component Bud32/tetratricopeptide (TPR) repeat protein
MKSHAESSDRETLLDEVVSEYLSAVQEGCEPDRGEWLCRHPDLAAELIEFFADRDRIQAWTRPLRDAVDGMLADTPSPDGAPTIAPGAWPELLATPRQFGDYELLARIGQGGMGIVFRARQISLNRLVALKMLRSDDLGTAAEAGRFRREAELVAELDHPHIVSVYEVGEREGRHFFSMKLIEGGNLLGRLPHLGTPREAALLVRTVAGAVDHAHQRGILHRDLKPSNILLDAEGRPYVTDFGLARRLHADQELTQARAVLGTPSYMAPEQTLGQAVTTATDVYGLGAILYALLTGQPPFAGDSVLDTLEQVRSQDPAPPTRLNPRVPCDLETICQKCLAKEPARRYAGARDMADDLGRWLQGEPIRARRISVAERAWKWARRKPAAAALVAVCVAAGLALVLGAVLYERRLRTALSETAAEKDRADTNYQEARDALKRILHHARVRGGSALPGLQELQREQHNDALAFFLRVAEQQSPSPDVRYDVASALLEAAEAQQWMGQAEAAFENQQRARRALATLSEEFPDRPMYRYQLAQALLAIARSGQCPPAESLDPLGEALRLIERLEHDEPEKLDYRIVHAPLLQQLGIARYQQDRPEKAEDYYRQAVTQASKLCEQQPTVARHRVLLANTQINLGLLLQNTKRDPTESYEAAAGILEELQRKHANDDDVIHSLAGLRINWASVRMENGQAETALAELARA